MEIVAGFAEEKDSTVDDAKGKARKRRKEEGRMRRRKDAGMRELLRFLPENFCDLCVEKKESSQRAQNKRHAKCANGISVSLGWDNLYKT